MAEKIKNTICIILIIIILPILIINLWVFIKSVAKPDEIPGFFGYKPFVVLTGSMEAEIQAGDLAIVKECDASKLKLQDIVAYRIENTVVVHRIVDKKLEEGDCVYVTKGDNNDLEDEKIVKASQIEGVYLYKISKLGKFVMFMQKPLGLIVAVGIPISLIIIIQIIENNKYRKELEEMKQSSSKKTVSKK